MDANSYEKFKGIIAEQLGVEPEQVTPDASFVDDLNADSLDLVELIMAFEEEYGMEIPDEDAEKIQTVGAASRHHHLSRSSLSRTSRYRSSSGRFEFAFTSLLFCARR